MQVSLAAARRLGGGMAASSLVLASLLSAAPTSAQAATQAGLVIRSVKFSGSAGDCTVAISGSGFGTLRGALPFTGTLANFRMLDNARIGNGEWGCAASPTHNLTFEHWTGA